MPRFLPVGKGVKGAAGFLLAALPALGAVLTGLAVTGDLVGVPGISVPCGHSREGLPIGLQILGRHFDEATVLRLAHAYEHASAQ